MEAGIWGWTEHKDDRGRYWWHESGMLLLELDFPVEGKRFALVRGEDMEEVEDAVERTLYYPSAKQAMRSVCEGLESIVNEWREAIDRRHGPEGSESD
jgi:hypothetical protein